MIAAGFAWAAIAGTAIGAMVTGADGLAPGLRTSAGMSAPAMALARGPLPTTNANPPLLLRSAPALASAPLEPGQMTADVALGARPGLHSLVASALATEIVARAEPRAGAAEVARFANPIASGAPLVFLVVDRAGDWLEVMLPIRPNGSTGWIRGDEVTVSRNRYRIEVDVSDHRMIVFQSDQTLIDTEVGIGTGTTPTPIGSFFLIELLAPSDPDGFYGPFAFGLSGYSETLTSYNGGVGVIGIHGTDDPLSLGRDSSNGCVRVANDVITRMAGILPLGTPVEIRP